MNAPTRQCLPERRRSWTQKVHIGGKTLYMTCGEYDDGRLGEIFLNYPRSGVEMQAMLSAFAQAMSINLQYGIPLDRLLYSLRDQNFLPQGEVSGSPEVRKVQSLMDYVVKQLTAIYLSPE